MIENILHKKIGGANLFSYFLVSALALAPSVSFADTTDNNVVTASVSEGTVFTPNYFGVGSDFKFRVNNNNTVTLVGQVSKNDFVQVPSTVFYKDENGTIQKFLVTEIADGALAGEDITMLRLPSSLKSIGANAFNCAKLSLVGFDDLFTSEAPCSLGDNAFGNNASLRISVPTSQVNAYKSAWSGYSSFIKDNGSSSVLSNGVFEYFTEYGEIVLTKYVGKDKVVRVPSRLEDPKNPGAFLSVRRYAPGIFKNNTNIETVRFDGAANDPVIMYEMFSGCSNLSKVYLAGWFDNLGWNSFAGCSKELVLYTETEVQWKDLHDAPSWQGFTIKRDPSVEEGAESNGLYYTVSSDMKNAVLTYIPGEPKNLIIASSVNCTYEGKEHVVPVTGIQDAESNSYVTSVTIPASIKNIDSDVFARYTKLTTVNILGSTPAKIGDNVFYKNATIFVPAGTKEVYQKAWPEYSSNIKESIAGVTFDEGNFQFKGGEDQKLTLLNYNGRDEKEVTIPEEIVHNGSSYPVACIAENAFNSCSDLQSVNILGTKVQFSAKSFNNCSQLCEIFVPEAAYDDYMKNVDLSNQQYYLAIKGAHKVLTDDEDYTGGKVIVYDKGELTYERTFQPGSQYATLCLPFSYLISETGFEEVYEPMYQIIHYTGNGDSKNNPKLILMLRKVADQLVSPGTPVFVKLGDSRKLSISNYEGVILGRGVNNILGKSMDVVDWDGTSGLMVTNTDFEVHYNGTYKHENAADIPGLYTFNGDGTFGPQTSGKLNPYRMYIVAKNSKLPAGAKYNISIGMNNGSTTGIQEIVTAPASKEAASSNAIYDLNGRLVSTTGSTQNLHKGVYIQNGKKLVVK